MSRLCSPSEVERRTGLSPDVLRDWRRRGLLTFGDQQENGRWAYKVGDVAHLAIVSFLTKWRIVSDLTDAFRLASFAVPYVYASIAGDESLDEELGDFPHLIGFVAHEGEPLQVEAVDDLDHARESFLVPGFIVIDTNLLAGKLARPLEGLFDVCAGRV